MLRQSAQTARLNPVSPNIKLDGQFHRAFQKIKPARADHHFIKL
jgi:hypothetical protein